MANYKFLIGIGVMLILVRVFLGTPPAQSAAVESQTLIALINQEREQRNLTTLLTHQSLVTAALEKSQDMIERDYFSHIDPDGNYIWNTIITAGYSPYKILGENLAIDFSTSEGMVQAWIDSPTHRENLLHPDFVHQGLAALYGDYNGRYTNLTTSLFGTLIASNPAPPPPQEETTPSPPPPPPIPPEPDLGPAQQAEDETDDETDDTEEPVLEEPEEQQHESAKPDLGFNIPSFPLQTGTPTPAEGFAGFSLTGPNAIRTVFLAFAIVFLAVLGIDSIVIYRRELKISRGHPSYHFFIIALAFLVFVLIWYWR